jgi:hypothetical protein
MTSSGDILREGIRQAEAFPEGARVRITNGTTGKVRLATVQPHGNLTPVARCDDGSLVVLGLVLADLPWLWDQTTVVTEALAEVLDQIEANGGRLFPDAVEEGLSTG